MLRYPLQGTSLPVEIGEGIATAELNNWCGNAR